MGETGIDKTIKLVSALEMRSLEEKSCSLGVSNQMLMDKAGLEIALSIAREVGHVRGMSVLVLVGPGNNGSDGLIAGIHLSSFGASVTAVLLKERNLADTVFTSVTQSDVNVEYLYKLEEDEALSILSAEMKKSFVIVDGIFGLGVNRPIVGWFERVVDLVAKKKRSDSLVFAIDVPTGLFIDTGQIDEVFLPPDVTLALGLAKIGHFTQPGASALGRLQILDIGIPNSLENSIKCNLITRKEVSNYFVARPSYSNKGTFGRALIVGGSINYVGAVVLATAAAYRSGVGLVTTVVPREIYSIVSNNIPEATLLPIDLDGSNSHIYKSANSQLLYENIHRYSSIVFGCGIGLSHEVGAILEDLLLSNLQCPPVVLDADGLNLLSRVSNWWERLSCHVVLTPHPGEMATLTGRTISEIQSRRIDLCSEYARKWGTVIVLKGANTIICDPSGDVWVSPWADPVLSVAGTGDVLSGLIGGFIAQGVPVKEAAILSVYIHGFAGETFSREISKSGLLASELLDIIPRCTESLRNMN
tara:strand:+ start:2743 stop:4335 length:1593 start_codon:yes stop_codon:yes gene_type:complete